MASPPPTPSSPNMLVLIIYPPCEEGNLVPADPSSVDLPEPPVGSSLILSFLIDRPLAQIPRLRDNLHAHGFRLYLDFPQDGGEGRPRYQSVLLGLRRQRPIPANILLSPEVGIYQASGSLSLPEITDRLNSIFSQIGLESLRYSTTGPYSGSQSSEFTSSDPPFQQSPMGWGRVASSFPPNSGQDQPLVYNPAEDLESGRAFISPYNMPSDFRSRGGLFSFHNISSNLPAEGTFFPTLLHPQSGGASSQHNGIDIGNGSGGNGGGQQPQNPSVMTETFMVVTAEVGLALMTVMSGSKNTLSTNEKILLYSAGVSNVGGFLCCLGATLKLASTRGQIATKTMAAMAKVATSYGFLAVMGTLLPDELMVRVTIPGALVVLIPLSYAFIKS